MTQAHNAARLAELLATRLCHDLASPLNGLTAGLGEMADASATAGDAFDLVREASKQLVDRVVMLRAAWGEASVAMNVADLKRLSAGMPRRRVEIDLSGIKPEASFPPESARLLLNVMLLALESLPRGGRLALEGDPAGGVVVMIEGAGAAWPEGLPGLIATPESAWTRLGEIEPRHLQGPLTVLIAHAAGQRLSLLLGGASERCPPLLVGFATH